MRQGYLVYNPASGRFPYGILAERAADLFRKHGWQLRVEKTRDSAHITCLAKQAANDGMDAFFIAGGDGSINLAAAGLVGTETALGVLPTGTSNVLAQEFGLPGLSWTRWLALEESANRLAKAGARWIDIGLCNGKPFLLWAGIGLDAFIVHRIRQREHWVKNFAVAHYLTTTLASANIWPGFNIKITINENEITGHFLVAVVSNIRLYAGGIARLSPEARLDDGVMELFLFKGETLRDTVQHIWNLYTGQHLQSDQVLHYKFQSLTLESDSKMFVQIDGDPVDGSAVLGIEVCPKALKVLVPDPIPHILFV